MVSYEVAIFESLCPRPVSHKEVFDARCPKLAPETAQLSLVDCRPTRLPCRLSARKACIAFICCGSRAPISASVISRTMLSQSCPTETRELRQGRHHRESYAIMVDNFRLLRRKYDALKVNHAPLPRLVPDDLENSDLNCVTRVVEAECRGFGRRDQTYAHGQ